VVGHIYNPSIQEAGRSLVQGQPGPCLLKEMKEEEEEEKEKEEEEEN
jgi:hypothetical protein